VLSGGHSAIDRKSGLRKPRAIALALPEWSGLDFEAYAARLPQAYWLKASLEEKLLHAKLLNRTEIEVSAPITHIRTDRDRGVTELTIIAPIMQGFVDRCRRLRGYRCQYRRCAGFYDGRWHGARHNFRFARFWL